MIKTYNQLIRDRIPEIIEASGAECKTEILSDEKYLEMIDAKLDEELAEYHKDQNIEELADLLEDINVYWNDDKTIVDTFVLKTINRFTSESNSAFPLMPEYKSDTDRDFATKLLRRAITGHEYFSSLIGSNTRGWDPNRIALMDRIILQLGLAEITTFPNIPISVSINEYVEIAKMYSTPKSGKYVNATLDTIAKQLMEEGKLVKSEQNSNK